MAIRGMILLPLLLQLKLDPVGGCVCPAATVLSRFPTAVPSDVCCLNYSGSAFGILSWTAFANDTGVEVLDLSNCNISGIAADGAAPPTLTELYLDRNRLTSLPRGFLARLPGLRVLDLGHNLLERLPEEFLRDSDGLQVLNVQENRLGLIPSSVLQKPSLHSLQLGGNWWDCSCGFVEQLEVSSHQQVNRTTKLRGLVGNLTCLSPEKVSGQTVWSVRPADVCRPAGLTALFIVLPLLLLSVLVLCWFCGRKKGKEAPSLGSSRKKKSGSKCNGQKLCTDAATVEQRECSETGIARNQLLLRPSSALLGSTRDIYEEVEIKLGSLESLPRAPSPGTKGDVDAVSVTEVLKDSSDREKAYLSQSTEYYSLVPGMQLDDSDHGEYESVDLS